MGKQCTQVCIGKHRLNFLCLGSTKVANLTVHLPVQFKFCSHAIVMSLDMTVTALDAGVLICTNSMLWKKNRCFIVLDPVKVPVGSKAMWVDQSCHISSEEMCHLQNGFCLPYGNTILGTLP